jgi:TRAP-type C4-dicarboxylate transport system permease small subunit
VNQIMEALKLADKIIWTLLKAITITSFFLLTILISANVFVRFVPIASLHWFDEIIEMLYAYLVFYGAAALWISREHFSVGDLIGKRLIKDVGTRHLYRMVLEVMVLTFVIIFSYYSLRLTILAQDVTNAFGIPKKILYSCLPASGAIMCVYSIRNIVCEIIGAVKAWEKTTGS